MRSSALARVTPLKRRTRLRPRRSKPRRSSRVRDEAYLAWVRTLCCMVCRKPPAEPHHVGEHGTSQKTHDRNAVPMCRTDHDAYHALRGFFKTYTKEDRRSWDAFAISATRAAWERRSANG